MLSVTPQSSTASQTDVRGVFRGGHRAMSTSLGRQDGIISIERYAKLWHAPPPPPFVTWAEGFSTETLSEDLFFDHQKLD